MMMPSKKSKGTSQIAYIGIANQTPLGPVWVAVSGNGLVRVEIDTQEPEFLQSLELRGFESFVLNTARVSKPVKELTEYLDGKRQTFNLRIDWSVMTSFQRRVLKLVSAIPYGETTTYGEIACELGKPQAARAVGQANANNPIPLIIPCHRVIGSDGKLRGYGAAGGIDTKNWLLHLEGWY